LNPFSNQIQIEFALQRRPYRFTLLGEAKHHFSPRAFPFAPLCSAHSSTTVDLPCHHTSCHQLQPRRVSPSSPSVAVLEPHRAAMKNHSKRADINCSIRHEDATSASLLHPSLRSTVVSSSSTPPRRTSTSLLAPAPTIPPAPHRWATPPKKCHHGTASVVSPPPHFASSKHPNPLACSLSRFPATLLCRSSEFWSLPLLGQGHRVPLFLLWAASP
jgi:hypothetical protein